MITESEPGEVCGCKWFPSLMRFDSGALSILADFGRLWGDAIKNCFSGWFDWDFSGGESSSCFSSSPLME
jgi:hypothetical protein